MTETPCVDHGRVGFGGGYGTCTYEGQRVLMHRAVFHQWFGFWPPVVQHECDNRRCVNPDHLRAGTWDSNNKDRAAKGRSAKFRKDLRVLCADAVRAIRSRYAGRGRRCPINGVSALAKEFGVDTNVIYQVAERRTYIEIE